MVEIHYTNLTNGLQCRCPDNREGRGRTRRYLRIQSTQLEQNLYTSVIDGLDYDFLWHLSQGHAVFVHDHSERARLTRALRQGLPFIVYAAARTWPPSDFDMYWPVSGVLLNRNGTPGMDVTDSFFRHWKALPDKTMKKLRYFNQHRLTNRPPLNVCAVNCQSGKFFRVPY